MACAAQVVKTEPLVSDHGRSFTRNTSSASLDSKLNTHLPAKNTSLLINEKVPWRARSYPGPKIMEVELMTPLLSDSPPGNGIADTSPLRSADSISMCTTTSEYNSLETLPSENIDDEDALSMKSIGRTNIDKLLLSERAQTPGMSLQNLGIVYLWTVSQFCWKIFYEVENVKKCVYLFRNEILFLGIFVLTFHAYT